MSCSQLPGTTSSQLIPFPLTSRKTATWLISAIFTIQRGPNQIAGSGSVRLLADEKDFTKQPATIQFAINAPQTGDFWNGNSPNRVTGVFNASGSVRWNGAIAAGWFNVYGTNLQTRNLSVPQLSGVGSIWQSTVFSE
jgi:hypothetical protein